MKGLGFVLSGGGARGAYVAGIIRYLYLKLPKKLGYSPWPRYVSGTSVGAINGYFCACHSMMEVRKMTELWTELHIGKMYNLPSGSISLIQQAYRSLFSSSVFDAKPFEELVRKEAARRTLRKSINLKQCHAFLVNATHMTSGGNTVFADTASPDIVIPRPAGGKVIKTRIYPEHILASSAIPMFFPPAVVDGDYYLDGNLRHYAPLQPLISMGVDRLLLLGTRSQTDKIKSKHNPKTPSLPTVASYALNAMSRDNVERDLVISEQLNTIVNWGKDNYGPDFGDKLAQDTGIENTRVLHISPSLSLANLAFQVFEESKIEADPNIKWILRKIWEQSTEETGSVVLSYLMFDKLYTQAAEDLGFRDAERMSETLISFFGEPRV